jgi:hypothetical protein
VGSAQEAVRSAQEKQKSDVTIQVKIYQAQQTAM